MGGGGWLDGIPGRPWFLSLSAGPAAWPSVWWPQPSSMQLPAAPPLSAPSSPRRWSLAVPFNIHLEMPNLGSWKPTRRVKFLATSKVFHFPPVQRRCDFQTFKKPVSCVPASPYSAGLDLSPTTCNLSGQAAVTSQTGGLREGSRYLPQTNPEKVPLSC